MNGWVPKEVRKYTMENGYWFMLCAAIEDAWDVCDDKLTHGYLESLSAEDHDLITMPEELEESHKLALCRNEELKYNTIMYNWFPIFKSLAEDIEFRRELNTRCYETVRLLEQGYGWYPISPMDTDDDLGLALNGKAPFKVPSVQKWFDNKKFWRFDIDRTHILQHPVVIRG
jgi:hypothetical protein